MFKIVPAKKNRHYFNFVQVKHLQKSLSVIEVIFDFDVPCIG
jgi:hypothetical protein